MQVTEVSMFYDFDKFTTAQQDLWDERARLAKLIYKRNNGIDVMPGCFSKMISFLTCNKKQDHEYTNEDKTEYNRLHHEVDAYKEKFSGPLCTEFQGIAVVSFKTVLMKDFAVDNWGTQYNCAGCVTTGHALPLTMNYSGETYTLLCDTVFEPSDMIFENQKYNYWSKLRRQVVAYFVVATVFLVGTAGIMWVYMAGQNLRSYNMKNGVKYPLFSWNWMMKLGKSSLVTLAIVLFNVVIDNIIRAMTKYRKTNDRTGEIIMTSQFSYKLQWVNSGLVPLLGAVAAMNYFGSTGLLASINDFFFLNMFVSNLRGFFDIAWY